jgi:hypothetical protein
MSVSLFLDFPQIQNRTKEKREGKQTTIISFSFFLLVISQYRLPFSCFLSFISFREGCVQVWERGEVRLLLFAPALLPVKCLSARLLRPTNNCFFRDRKKEQRE